MTKVIVLLTVAAIAVAVYAYPLEENVADDKESPAKVSPILAADKIQNKTTGAQDAKSEDNTEQHTSDYPESTEVYIEESYIAVLLPGLPQLNTTTLEALLNKTGNTTDDDDGVRSKRNTDEKEIQLENVSPPTSGSTVPAVLYSLRNSNDDSADGGSSSKASISSSAAPPLYQLRNLNTRGADKDDGSSSKESSEETSKGSKNVHDSSSSEESSEEKTKVSDDSTDVASPNTPNNRPKRSLDQSSAKISGAQEKGSLKKSEALNRKDNEEPNKAASEAKVQQPTSTVATHPLYSAQNFYSRPARQASGYDGINLSSKDTKTRVLETSSNNKGLRGASPNDHLKSSSRSNVGPIYSAQYANVRHAREVVDSSEEESSTTSTEDSVSTSLSG